MKKTKLYAKKTLSVFMAVMMLMTAWVFVAPERARAASTYPVTVKFNNPSKNPSGHMKVYYFNVNSDGTVDTSNTSQNVIIINSLTGDGYGAAGNQSAGPFNIPGWPWKVEIRAERGTTVRFLGFYIGSIEVTGMVANDNEGYNINGAITKSWAYNDNTNLSSGSIAKKNWNFPAVSGVRSAPVAQTISVPAVGSASQNFTATFNDQYDVQWPSSNGMNAALSPALSGASVSLSGNTATVTGDINVFNNSGYNSSNGQIKTVLQMTLAGKLASCDVTFQAPKYNVVLKDIAGNIAATYNSIGYYNQSVTLPNLPANTKPTKIAGDDNYHQLYDWPVEAKQAFYITGNTTYEEVKGQSQAHTYGAWSQNDANHTRTCSVCGYVQTQAHIKGEGYVTKAETCTEDGVMTYDCSVCGKKAIETSVINTITGHDFSGTAVENVTGENGNHWRKCSRCDTYGWDGVANACDNHNWDKNADGKVDANDAETKASTCKETGYEKYTCKVCNATWTKELPLAAHKTVATAAKDVTNVCGGDGNVEFWTCSVCDKIYTDAACLTEVTDYTDADGDKIPDVLERKGPAHSFTGAYVAVADGADGTHYRQCSRFTQCGAYGLEVDGVPTVGATEKHNFTSTETASSCTVQGERTYTCSDCKSSYTEKLPLAAHSMEKTDANPATCTEKGNNEYYYCSTCNKYYKDEAGTTVTTVADETLSALGHTFAAGNSDENHPETDEKLSNATCQAAAVYRVTCDRCDTKSADLTYSSGSPDTVNGHQFNGEIRKNDNGTHSYKCTVEGCEEYGNETTCEFTIPVIDVPSTCHTLGYTITKCKTCGKENRVDKTAYDFDNHDGEEEVRGEVKATCAQEGYTGDIYCLGCKAKKSSGTSTLKDPSNHENMIDYDGKEATCQVEGYTDYRYCWLCDTYEIEKVTINKKDHAFKDYVTNNDGTHTAICDTCKAEDGEIAKDTEPCQGGEATCVAKKVCTVCNTEYGEIDENNHVNKEYVAKVPATCQTEGTEAYYKCADCGDALDEIVKIEKLSHTYSVWAKVDGEDKHTRSCTTCDESVAAVDTQTEDCSGGIAYCNALAKCTTCKAEYGEVNTENHATEASYLDGAYDATCQAPGYTGDRLYVCCNALKEKGEATQQLTHKFDLEVEGSRVDATCIAKGTVTYKCSTCVETDDVKAATDVVELNIDAKNHASEETVTVGAKAATCESDGNTGDIYHKCCYDANKTENENRKALVSKGTVIKANGQHVYSAAVAEYMIKEIKETKDDEGKVISREIVLKDAEPAYGDKVAARRDDDKWYHVKQCTICGDIAYEACYTYAHTYNCVDTDTCEVCEGLCSLIDANKHKADLVEVTDGAKDATCVSNGVKSYYKCADCDKTFFDEAGKKPFDPEKEEDQAALVIDKTTVGHTIDWENPAEEVEGNCGTSGYKLYKCSVEGCKYETRVDTGIASNAHTWKTEYDVIKEATCGTNGYKAIKCEVCGATKSNSTVIIPATEEHDFDKNKDSVVDRNDAVITEGVDCQTPGTLTYTCQVCEATKVEIDTEGVSAHTWGEWVTKGGDCSTGILLERICTVCGATEQERKDTDAHQFELYIEVLPTAQKDGYRIEKCANCGIEKRTELPYNGSGEGGEGGETPDTPETDKHVVDENIYIVHEKADCRHGEIRRYTCIICGEMVEREVGEPTDHIWMTQAAEAATCSKPGHSEYKRCLICLKEDGRVDTDALGHNDSDGNGKCDSCNSAFYDDGEGSKTCGCICHKENFFMQFIYKILRFFWKLFKIGHSCDCGAVHY